MLTLDHPDKSIEIKLGSAVTSNELPVVVCYVQYSVESILAQTTFNCKCFDTKTSGTSPTVIAPYPDPGLQNRVDSILVQNEDSANATVIIQYRHGSDIRQIFKFTLSPNDSFVYNGSEVKILDSMGNTKISGPQGSQGNTGSQGFQGNTGVTGSQGNTGAQGNQGFQGNIGTTGNQGFQGDTGAIGSQGSQGVAGNNGAQGNQGFQGNTGTTGNQGATGNTGSQGSQGDTGITGSQGFQGDDGNTGNQGFQGAPGSGAQGAQGSAGSNGAQGSQGFQGLTGSGAQGAQGTAGSNGSQGAQGSSGSSGAQGFQGNDGGTGAQGAQGFQGGSAVTVKALSSDQTSSIIVPAKVTGLDQVAGPGTYVFQYYIRYRSSVAGTGVRFDVNHSGTVTSFVWIQRWVDVSATASTGAPDQDEVLATGAVVGAFASRAKGTTGRGTTLSVDTVNLDMLMIIEGIMVVTVSGNLELYFGSEAVGSTQTIMANSSLILTKTA